MMPDATTANLMDILLALNLLSTMDFVLLHGAQAILYAPLLIILTTLQLIILLLIH